MNTAQIPIIEIEIDIEASVEHVWRAWTTPEEVIAWWGEDGKYRVTRWDGDVRPGGKWRADGIGVDGSAFVVEGEYVEVQPPTRLSFTWRTDWDPASGETMVTIDIAPAGSGAHLRLQHAGLAGNDSRTSHDKGWIQVLGWLDRYLTAEHKS